MTDLLSPRETGAGPARTVYTVTQLNHAVRDLLEHSFPLLLVEGEISNLAQPRSGHWYFSLKDEQSQVRCAMFRNKNQLLRFAPGNGMQVTLRARISLYPARGDYQLIVEHMEEAGAGALQRAFEQLKARLEAEGLFDEQHKRPLPALPQRIGVITSATGAALQDVLSVLRRRFALGSALLYPVPVQGDAAAPAICRALTSAGQRRDCDVLLLVRGGGSLEDLWAFNEEAVARAIRACPVPVVAGVGHEVDTSIADYAADLRAPTPSAAAELVCPDGQAWVRQLDSLQSTLRRELGLRLITARQDTQALDQRLRRLHPERQLREHSQRLDDLEQRLRRIHAWRQEQRRNRLRELQSNLLAAGPRVSIQRRLEHIGHLNSRSGNAMQQRLQEVGTRCKVAARGLHAVSPLQTLERGYAIASEAGGKVVTRASTLKTGDFLQIRLMQGRVDCEVTQTHSQSGDDKA